MGSFLSTHRVIVLTALLAGVKHSYSPEMAQWAACCLLCYCRKTC